MSILRYFRSEQEMHTANSLISCFVMQSTCLCFIVWNNLLSILRHTDWTDSPHSGIYMINDQAECILSVNLCIHCEPYIDLQCIITFFFIMNNLFEDRLLGRTLGSGLWGNGFMTWMRQMFLVDKLTEKDCFKSVVSKFLLIWGK